MTLTAQWLRMPVFKRLLIAVFMLLFIQLMIEFFPLIALVGVFYLVGDAFYYIFRTLEKK